MITKIKSGCPKKYEGDIKNDLKNMRQIIYYRKINGLIDENEYKLYTVKYKIKLYEYKIEKLKEELEEIEEWMNLKDFTNILK